MFFFRLFFRKILIQNCFSLHSRHRHTLRRFHRHCWIHLFVVILTELIATNTCDAAQTILQPTNDAMNMNKTHSSDNHTDSFMQLSERKFLKRDKRFLLFTGGGISKVSLIIIHFAYSSNNCFGCIFFADCFGLLGTCGNTRSSQLAYLESGL